jgi:hypothetical protein
MAIWTSGKNRPATGKMRNPNIQGVRFSRKEIENPYASRALPTTMGNLGSLLMAILDLFERPLSRKNLRSFYSSCQIHHSYGGVWG